MLVAPPGPCPLSTFEAAEISVQKFQLSSLTGHYNRWHRQRQSQAQGMTNIQTHTKTCPLSTFEAAEVAQQQSSLPLLSFSSKTKAITNTNNDKNTNTYLEKSTEPNSLLLPIFEAAVVILEKTKHRFQKFPKMIFLPKMDKEGFCRGASEQKINSCLEWTKGVQMGPKGVPNGQKHLCWQFWSLSDPFGSLWSVDKPAMFGSFWSKMDHFWAIPSHERSIPE